MHGAMRGDRQKGAVPLVWHLLRDVDSEIDLTYPGRSGHQVELGRDGELVGRKTVSDEVPPGVEGYT